MRSKTDILVILVYRKTGSFCVFQLKRKFKLNKSVQKVKVKKREMKSGRQVVAAGWGKQEVILVKYANSKSRILF